MTSGTPDGEMVAEMIKQGQIVPSHVTISLLEKAMLESGKRQFLIDGFPRNEENRSAFESQVCPLEGGISWGEGGRFQGSFPLGLCDPT
jgi:adenylate kinase family enzyme